LVLQKVIIFTGVLSEGGAEKQSILLAKALNNKFKIILVSFYGTRSSKRHIHFFEKEKINYLLLKGNAINKTFKFSRLVKNFRPDIIINFLPSNNIIGGLVGKIYGVKKIYSGVRSSRLSWRKYLEILFSHHLLSNATIFNNTSGYNYFIRRGFLERKSIVIPNCIFPMQKQKSFENNEHNNTINILMVARFEYYKDYFTALRSVKKAHQLLQNKKIIFNIVGIGSQEALIKNWIKELSIEEITNIYINPDNIDEFYLKSDIFIQTSLFEGFSNSIMEAMSFSLPVITTDVGDNSVLVKEGINGYLTKVKDINTISDRIVYLVYSDKTRYKMGLKSYEYIKNNFTIKKFAQRFTELFENS
tara:strand:+ start:113 stop:1192 length:1080 start_codon:yes stop_codon:yes gene_type:complete